MSGIEKIGPAGEPLLPALPENALKLTSIAVAAVAKKAIIEQVEAAKKPRTWFSTVVQFMGDINPIVEAAVDFRDLTRKTADRVDKHVIKFLSGEVVGHCLLAEGALFNIISLFRRGLTFAVAVRDAAEFWAYSNIKERLDTLADAMFKFVRLGESTLSFAEKIASLLQYVLLSLPLACIGIITSTISAIKALVTAATLEGQRLSILGQTPKERNEKRLDAVMGYCERHMKFIKDDNDAVRRNLVARGASPDVVDRFLSARLKWSLTGFFGTKSYPLMFQGFKRIRDEIKNVESEYQELQEAPQSELRDLQMEFLTKRKGELVDEGNIWVDRFMSSMAVERAQQAMTFFSNLMVVTASVVALAAMFATIHYWGIVVLTIVVVAAFLSLMNSLYSLWQRQRITFQEKEGAIDMVTAHFTERMKKIGLDDKRELAGAFGFALDDRVLTNNDLLAKQFEEHLKKVLHQEKIERHIDRAFLDTIRQQVQKKGTSISSAEVEKFEKDMTKFFVNVLQSSESGKKIFEKGFIDAAARARDGVHFEKEMANTFFYYLSQLDVVA